MPIGPSNLRVLWGAGDVVISADTDTSIVWMGFGNIGDVAYGVYLQSNGRLVAFDTTTVATSEILPASTITNPSTILGSSQWGSQYLIFAKDQQNGYWLWDDNSLFTAGTLGPDVVIDNSGLDYTSAPTITLQTTGSGTGAVLTAQIDAGSLSQVTVTNPGSGFALGDFVAATVTGGGSDDQALASAPTIETATGGVSQITILNGGSGYTTDAKGFFVGGGLIPGGENAQVVLGIQNGTINQVAILFAGHGYSSPPTLVISASHGGDFNATVQIEFGQITAIGIANQGTGYLASPTVKIIGDGTGAEALANVAFGGVIGVTMTSFGKGYSKALAVFQGGNHAANVSPALMPFGVSGTTVEVYQQHAWVANGAAVADFPPKNRVLFSAAATPADFGDGGGGFRSTDSFLRIGYHWLKQTNGFLYLGGDSSLNYISGVQTSAATASVSPLTTFGNQNVDPQIGSPWPSSVQVFSRNLVFANTVGVFVSYGGAITKASLQLDGFYGLGPIYGSTSNFSSAVATIFGIPVYMLLLPTVDQYTQQTVNKLLMWDGKRWFTSQQDRPLTFIATQEINSVLTAWGTDGQNIFRLFDKPSTGFQKVVISKLYSQPTYIATKTAIRLNGVAESFAVDQGLTIYIDNEEAQGSGNAQVAVPAPTAPIVWKNNVGAVATWTNNAAAVVDWLGPGLQVFGPYPVGQAGRMTGFTIVTSASDLALLSVNLSEQVETVNI